MMFAYDPRLDEEAAERIQDAQHAFEEASAPARLPAWLRLQSWKRLADAQRDHVHWWYSRTMTAAICTCGLISDVPTPPVHAVVGHRDVVARKATRLLVIPSGHRVRPEREPMWTLVCQACKHTSDPVPRETARRIYERHLRSCHSLRAEQDPFR